MSLYAIYFQAPVVADQAFRLNSSILSPFDVCPLSATERLKVAVKVGIVGFGKLSSRDHNPNNNKLESARRSRATVRTVPSTAEQ